ncbi:MAG: hypothetical protein R3E72_03440 [Steroidobacteraceae bacterium]
MLLVTTPIGVVWGIVEASRFHWWLGVLMTVLMGVIGAFVVMTIRRVRRDRSTGHSHPENRAILDKR